MLTRLLVLVAVVSVALGFAPAPKPARALMRLNVALNKPTNNKVDVWKSIDDAANLVPTILIAMASTVEPSMLLLLNPAISVMDPEKVVKSPAKYIKPQYANEFGKKSFWAQQDIADTFAASFGVPTSQELRKRKAFYEKIDIIDEEKLFESLDEYVGHSKFVQLMAMEPENNYIGDATVAAFKPFDRPMNMEKVNRDPMFFKPVPLSKMDVARGPHKNHVLHL